MLEWGRMETHGMEVNMAPITFSGRGTEKIRPLKRMLFGLAVAMLACVIAGCAPGGGTTLGAPFKNVAVGDTVTFGSFAQDNNTSNGNEPIEWRVLAVEDNRALLVSVYALDSMPFNASDKQGNSWEDSDLMAWLSGEFMDSAFTEGEQGKIAEITCLSVEEARMYFADDSSRSCKPTAHAATNGATSANGGCYWWLRSAGTNGKEYVAFIAGDGRVMAGGQPVSNRYPAVRPAIWVSVD